MSFSPSSVTSLTTTRELVEGGGGGGAAGPYSPASLPPPGASAANNASSLRVRFRMTTRHSSQHQFRAKISSNSPSISQSSSFSKLSPRQLESAPTVTPPTPLNHQNHHHHQDSVWFFNSHASTSNSVNNLNEFANLPINIGLNCTNNNNKRLNSLPNDSKSSLLSSSSTHSNATTTKTFRLTEDLRSNIRLDITLKPTLSIRDDRLDATARLNRLKQMHNASSSSSLMQRSMSCESTNTLGLQLQPQHQLSSSSKRANFSCMEVIRSSSNRLESHSSSGYSSRCCNTDAPVLVHANETDVVSTSVPYHTSIPLNSSITFKIRNFMRTASSSDLANKEQPKVETAELKEETQMPCCKRSASSVCMIKSASLCRSNSRADSCNAGGGGGVTLVTIL